MWKMQTPSSPSIFVSPDGAQGLIVAFLFGIVGCLVCQMCEQISLGFVKRRLLFPESQSVHVANVKCADFFITRTIGAN